jgi:competence protein ComEA
MGRHSQDHASVTGDWEELPPVAPLWRARIVTSAVLLLAVIAASWWAVSWLTSPAGPTGAPAPQAAALEGPEGPHGEGLDGEELSARGQESTARGGEVDQGERGEGSGQGGHGPAEAGTESGAVIVHVAGEVHEPGLVELPAGSRVADALRAAGGPTSRAELDLLNLAALAVDASQIAVPGPDTPVAGPGVAPGAGPGGQPGTAADDGGGPTNGTVNVNTADAAALEQLPGIGPALAGRIVEHREQVGPYGSLADLDAVSGIGPAMMERLDGLVSW